MMAEHFNLVINNRHQNCYLHILKSTKLQFCHILKSPKLLSLYVYTKKYEQHQEKTSRIARPWDEKGKARAFVDNRKDRRKKKQRSSKNKNTRRYSSLAGKKHCGDVCGCKRSQNVEGHDRLRLQQTRQLMTMMMILKRYQ